MRLGTSRRPETEEKAAMRGRFAETAIGYVLIDVCELRLAAGRLHMFLAWRAALPAESRAAKSSRRIVCLSAPDGREAEFSSRRQFLRAPPQEGMGRAESRASDRICIFDAETDRNSIIRSPRSKNDTRSWP